jgi:hypothetical protein
MRFAATNRWAVVSAVEEGLRGIMSHSSTADRPFTPIAPREDDSPQRSGGATGGFHPRTPRHGAAKDSSMTQEAVS